MFCGMSSPVPSMTAVSPGALFEGDDAVRGAGGGERHVLVVDAAMHEHGIAGRHDRFRMLDRAPGRTARPAIAVAA